MLVLTTALHLPQKGKLRLWGEWEVQGYAQRKRDLKQLDSGVHVVHLGTQGPSRSWAGFLVLFGLDEDTRDSRGIQGRDHAWLKAETRLCISERGGQEKGQEREGVRGEGRSPNTDLTVLLVVADEVSQLLLAALQRGVKLLHLAHQVGLLAL